MCLPTERKKARELLMPKNIKMIVAIRQSKLEAMIILDGETIVESGIDAKRPMV